MNWKKVWNFIWKEDSFASLFVNVVLAIVIIKFIIFPVLGLLLGTSFPVVAVVSCSMDHSSTNCWADCYLKESGLNECINKPASLCGQTGDDFWNNCGQWYEDKGITEERFQSFPQKNGFKIGDIFILTKAKNIEVGDIIVYNNNVNNAPIIHRVVSIINEDGKIYYQTKGDHNQGIFAFEDKISSSQVYGKALLKVPFLGWVKIGFNMILKTIGII